MSIQKVKLLFQVSAVWRGVSLCVCVIDRSERRCHSETQQTHSCGPRVMSVSVGPTPALKQTQVTLAGMVAAV